MASPADGIFQRMADQFVTQLSTGLFQDVGNFISNISPLFAAGFSIYVMLIALDAYNRGLDENMVDLSKRMMGWLVIISLAFNASQYGSLAQWIYGLPDAVSASFGKNIDAGVFDAAIAKTDRINIVFNEIIINLVKDDLDNIGLALLFVGLNILVHLMIYLFLAVIFAYYVVAKILLALNLMVGPLFLGAMLFPATRTYGMNWIGQCLNFIFTVVLLSALMGVEIQFFTETIRINFGEGNNIASNVLDRMATSAAVFGVFFVCLLMTAVFIYAAFKVPAMTSALTGGASLEGVSGRLGSTLANQPAAKNLNNNTLPFLKKLLSPNKIKNGG